jgi:hypothetical protein
MVVEANATHLAHTVLSSFDGSLLDQVTLTKPAGWRAREASGHSMKPVAVESALREAVAADGGNQPVGGGRGEVLLGTRLAASVE